MVHTHEYHGLLNTYTRLAVAPLHIKLPPTQLYSSARYLLILFVVLKSLSRYYQIGTGRFALLYLMGMSLERFLIDFFRGDRIMNGHPVYGFLSFHQWIALALFCIASLGFLYLSQKSSISPMKKA